MTRTEAFSEVAVEDAGQLRDWLGAHHGQDESVWLVTWKKDAGPRHLDREAVLDALIAFGWIDGIRRARDDGRTMQLISRRRQQDWTRSYRDRAERLEAEGLMAEPGRDAVRAAKLGGTWEANEDVDDLVVPADLAVALGPAETWFRQAAPSYRRNVLRWISKAKQPETRARRIAQTVSSAERAEKMRNF